MKGPPLSLSVRAATPADEQFLVLLDADRHAGDLGSLPLPPDQLAVLLEVQYRARRQAHTAAFPDAQDTVAEVAGQPAGRVLVDEGPDLVHIVDIAVLADFRGRGIGTALVRAVLHRAAAARLPVRLHAAAHDAALLAWYGRLGFSVTRPGVPDVEMTWHPRIG